MRIGRNKINSFAYANDLTLLCTPVSGLQSLLIVCVDCVAKWRRRFNPKKSKCRIIGNQQLQESPCFSMYDDVMKTVGSLNILGVDF